MAGQKLGPQFLSSLGGCCFHVLCRMHRQDHMPWPGISSRMFKVNSAIPLTLLLVCSAAFPTVHSSYIKVTNSVDLLCTNSI